MQAAIAVKNMIKYFLNMDVVFKIHHKNAVIRVLLSGCKVTEINKLLQPMFFITFANAMKRFVIYMVFAAFVWHSSRAYDFAAYAPYDRLWTDAMLQNGLPVHYKFLPLLLTGADAGFRGEYVAGAWALSVPVACHYGLKIDAAYDERLDVRLATDAAVAYLTDLKKIYAGDVEKQLSVYAASANCFGDSVSGTLDSRLAWLAVEWKSTSQEMARPDMFSADTSWVCLDNNLRVSDFCALLGLDSLQLFSMNPCLSPSAQYLKKGYRIYLPQESRALYAGVAAQLDSLSLPDKPVACQPTLPAPKLQYVVYRVRAGDTLGHIAMRYHVGVSQLKRWNNLRSDMLQIGQRIKIYK